MAARAWAGAPPCMLVVVVRVPPSRKVSGHAQVRASHSGSLLPSGGRSAQSQRCVAAVERPSRQASFCRSWWRWWWAWWYQGALVERGPAARGSSCDEGRQEEGWCLMGRFAGRSCKLVGGGGRLAAGASSPIIAARCCAAAYLTRLSGPLPRRMGHAWRGFVMQVAAARVAPPHLG